MMPRIPELTGLPMQPIFQTPAAQGPTAAGMSQITVRSQRLRMSYFKMATVIPSPLWQLLTFVGPLLFLLSLSFWSVRNFQLTPGVDPANWEKVLQQGHFWDAYLRTAANAMCATIITSLLAFPAALAIAFVVSSRRQRLIIFILMIPFFTSYLVRIYAWQVFLNDSGIINSALQVLGIAPIRMLNTVGASMVGYVTLSLPLVVLIQAFSLINVDKTHIEAAYNLGCHPLRAIFQVVLPSARTGFAIAGLFCFIFSYGDFVSPLYLGGGASPTLSMHIIDVTKAGQQWPRAAVVATMMIATLLLVATATTRYAYGRRK